MFSYSLIFSVNRDLCLSPVEEDTMNQVWKPGIIFILLLICGPQRLQGPPSKTGQINDNGLR